MITRVIFFKKVFNIESAIVLQKYEIGAKGTYYLLGRIVEFFTIARLLSLSGKSTGFSGMLSRNSSTAFMSMGHFLL